MTPVTPTCRAWTAKLPVVWTALLTLAAEGLGLAPRGPVAVPRQAVAGVAAGIVRTLAVMLSLVAVTAVGLGLFAWHVGRAAARASAAALQVAEPAADD